MTAELWWRLVSQGRQDQRGSGRDDEGLKMSDSFGRPGDQTEPYLSDGLQLLVLHDRRPWILPKILSPAEPTQLANGLPLAGRVQLGVCLGKAGDGIGRC